MTIFRRCRVKHALVALATFGGCTPLPAIARCTGLPALALAPKEAVPTPRPGWQDRAPQLETARIASGIDRARVVFLGDSLTARWPRTVWNAYFAPLGAFNLGVSGDRTEWLLWRLQVAQWGNGAAAIQPQVAVLLIGTNNLAQRARPEDIAAGVQAVIDFIEEQSPETRVLLLSIWPRRGDAGLQARRTRLNEILNTCEQAGRVTVVDMTQQLAGPDGQFDPQFYRDGVHLNDDGYQRIAPALRQAIEVALQSRSTPP